MQTESIPSPRFFSRFANTVVTNGNLPHWTQPGVVAFVTFRLHDSLPQDKVRQLQSEQAGWEQAHPQPWTDTDRFEHARLFEGRMQEWLDADYGCCSLRNTVVRQLVEDTLMHFNGDRYFVYSYVVKPNHVHALVMPYGGQELTKILKSWKSFTAVHANRLLGTEGAFWQRESWDRLIRDTAHFRRVLRYIHQNDPDKAYSVYGGIDGCGG